MSKKFKKYMSPYGVTGALLTCITLLALGFFVGLMVREQRFATAPLVIFGLLFIVSLRPFFVGRAFFRSLEEKNINAIEQDFARAYPFVKGKVRLGQSYIFTKGSGKLVAYSDIVQIYQHIHSISGIEDKRMLKYIDADGKHHALCPLRLKGKSDSEMKDILTVIRQKNRDVKVHD